MTDVFCLDIETSGLDPKESFVSVIGVYGPFGLQIFAKESEKATLEAFETFYAGISNAVLVTYNGLHFDFPFLEKRARLHGLTPLADWCGEMSSIETGASKNNHVDLILKARNAPFLKSFYANRERFSKDELCRHLGIYVPRAASGAECAWRAQRFQRLNSSTDSAVKRKAREELSTIVEHNALDLVATMRLCCIFEEEGWL